MNWVTDCLMEIGLKEILTRLSLVDHSFDENQMESEDHQFILSRVDYWMILMSRLKRVPADENELVLNSTGLSKLKKEQKCLKRENGNHSDGQSASHKGVPDPMWVVNHPGKSIPNPTQNHRANPKPNFRPVKVTKNKYSNAETQWELSKERKVLHSKFVVQNPKHKRIRLFKIKIWVIYMTHIIWRDDNVIFSVSFLDVKQQHMNGERRLIGHHALLHVAMMDANIEKLFASM